MYDGITIERGVQGGVPVIAGANVPVATVVGELGNGRGMSEVLADHPNLTKEGVLACLRFAARTVNERD
jgi:uncharacterized protein (DUF433 family)